MPESTERLCACKQRALLVRSVDSLRGEDVVTLPDALPVDDPMPWPVHGQDSTEFLQRLAHAVRDLQQRVAELECAARGHPPVEP